MDTFIYRLFYAVYNHWHRKRACKYYTRQLSFFGAAYTKIIYGILKAICKLTESNLFGRFSYNGPSILIMMSAELRLCLLGKQPGHIHLEIKVALSFGNTLVKGRRKRYSFQLFSAAAFQPFGFMFLFVACSLVIQTNENEA